MCPLRTQILPQINAGHKSTGSLTALALLLRVSHDKNLGLRTDGRSDGRTDSWMDRGTRANQYVPNVVGV